MRSLLIALISIFGAALHNVTFAQSCYETTVQSQTPFMGNNGEIVKLADGSLWEVKYAYEYLYEYYPAVIILPEKREADGKEQDDRCSGYFIWYFSKQAWAERH